MTLPALLTQEAEPTIQASSSIRRAWIIATIVVFGWGINFVFGFSIGLNFTSAFSASLLLALVPLWVLAITVARERQIPAAGSKPLLSSRIDPTTGGRIFRLGHR